MRQRRKNRHDRPHPVALTRQVDAFLQHLRARKYQPASVSKRHSDLKHLLDYLHDHDIARFQDVDPAVLHAYHTQLHAAGYADQTVSSAITAVRRLFAWLEATAVLFENPARALTGHCATTKQLGLVLDHAQVKRLLAVPALHTHKGRRDRAILETLYATGIRLSECTAIELPHLDLQARTLQVYGKGSKERLLPLGTQAAEHIASYLEHTRAQLLHRSHGSPGHTRLWLSHTGAPLGKQTIQITVRTCARTAQLPTGTDTHTLRRTCATHLLRNGAHPLLVAKLLGHADLKTLGHYLKTTIADLMETHAKTNPGR